MPKIPSEVDDDYCVSFTIMPHWSWLRFSGSGKTLELAVSEIMRPAAEHILGLCEALIDNAHAAEPFYDEPGGYVWRLTPDQAAPRTMQLDIFELPPQARSFSFREADCEDAVISLTVERRLFLMILMAELWKNALLCKDPAYQKKRRHFPWKLFRQIVEKWDRSSLGPSLAAAP